VNSGFPDHPMGWIFTVITYVKTPGGSAEYNIKKGGADTVYKQITVLLMFDNAQRQLIN
jgi:hypothetical protein